MVGNPDHFFHGNFSRLSAGQTTLIPGETRIPRNTAWETLAPIHTQQKVPGAPRRW